MRYIFNMSAENETPPARLLTRAVLQATPIANEQVVQWAAAFQPKNRDREGAGHYAIWSL